MTGIEVYQKLRASGTGDQILAAMRPYLKANPQASAEEFQQHCQEISRPNESNSLAAGTLNKIKNLVEGRDADFGMSSKPYDWDDTIDGPWVPKPTATGEVKLINVPPQNLNPQPPEPMPAKPLEPAQVASRVIKVQQPSPSERGEFDIGPKKVK